MNPENKQILDAHEHFYKTYVKTQTIRGLSTSIKDDLLRVMREEFHPGYTYDQWCNHCVGAFISDVYKKYNEWKTANPVTVEQIPEPEQETKKIKIKATFPRAKMQ